MHPSAPPFPETQSAQATSPHNNKVGLRPGLILRSGLFAPRSSRVVDLALSLSTAQTARALGPEDLDWAPAVLCLMCNASPCYLSFFIHK